MHCKCTHANIIQPVPVITQSGSTTNAPTWFISRFGTNKWYTYHSDPTWTHYKSTHLVRTSVHSWRGWLIVGWWVYMVITNSFIPSCQQGMGLFCLCFCMVITNYVVGTSFVYTWIVQHMQRVSVPKQGIVTLREHLLPRTNKASALFVDELCLVYFIWFEH